MCPNPSTKGPGDDDEGQTKPGRAQGKLQRFRCMQAGSLVWLAEPHNQSISIFQPYVRSTVRWLRLRVQGQAGRQAVAPSSRVCSGSCSFCSLAWCGVKCRCWAAEWLSCERTDSNCPLARSLVHFPQPPSGRCGNLREGPLHNRRSVAVFSGRPGQSKTAIVRDSPLCLGREARGYLQPARAQVGIPCRMTLRSLDERTIGQQKRRASWGGARPGSPDPSVSEKPCPAGTVPILPVPKQGTRQPHPAVMQSGEAVMVESIGQSIHFWTPKTQPAASLHTPLCNTYNTQFCTCTHKPGSCTTHTHTHTLYTPPPRSNTCGRLIVSKALHVYESNWRMATSYLGSLGTPRVQTRVAPGALMAAFSAHSVSSVMSLLHFPSCRRSVVQQHYDGGAGRWWASVILNSPSAYMKPWARCTVWKQIGGRGQVSTVTQLLVLVPIGVWGTGSSRSSNLIDPASSFGGHRIVRRRHSRTTQLPPDQRRDDRRSTKNTGRGHSQPANEGPGC